MTDVPDVAIVPAVADDAALIANLLELYQHDLSEIFPVELGATGRFGACQHERKRKWPPRTVYRRPPLSDENPPKAGVKFRST